MRASAGATRLPSRANTTTQPSRCHVLRLIMGSSRQRQFPRIQVRTHGAQAVLKTPLHQAPAAEQHTTLQHQVDSRAEVVDHEIAVLIYGHAIVQYGTGIALQDILYCRQDGIDIAIRWLAQSIPQAEFIRCPIVYEGTTKSVTICHHEIAGAD